MTLPQLKPSPVHESSLRQALQRVEDRLRQQEQNRKRNAHHERTLKLAREFASQGIRQRHLEWERQQRKEQAKDGIQIEAPPGASPQPALEAPHGPAPSGQVRPQTADKSVSGRPASKVIPLVETLEAPPDGQGIDKAPVQAAKPTPDTRSASDVPPPRGLSRLMPVVAWLILCSGIIGAALSWTTLTDVHASPQTVNSVPFNGLPMGLLLGFAYLATGVLGFAFFWVSALIGNQLKEIRRLLFLQSMMNRQPDQTQP